jgi:hypothetical protein
VFAASVARAPTFRRTCCMTQSRSPAPPPWTAFGIFLGLLAFLAAAGLHSALWHLAGLAVVAGVGAATVPLEHRRRDHTAHTAFPVP